MEGINSGVCGKCDLVEDARRKENTQSGCTKMVVERFLEKEVAS